MAQITAQKFRLFFLSVRFYGVHIAVIGGLSLLAAICRAIQTGAFGEAGGSAFLEIIVALLRISIVLVIVGDGSAGKGWSRIKYAFSREAKEKDYWSVIVRNFTRNWVDLLVNVLIFAVFILLLNFLIARLAGSPGLLSALSESGILSEASSSAPVVLFLKNLTVIPLTLVFQYFVLLKLLGRV